MDGAPAAAAEQAPSAAGAEAPAGRWRCGCVRAASRTSSARRTCSAPARRCGPRSSRGGPHSMVLYGPPGSGKTTLARIVAERSDAAFEELSAVAGRARGGARGDRARRPPPRRPAARQTVLFLDEIHRFNKAQQDALLPAVEEGLVTLIGATTENPAFEVNGALLSRLRVYALQALSREEVAGAALRRARGRGCVAIDDGGARVPRRAQRRRRAHRAQRPRAGRRDGRRARASERRDARARRGCPAAPGGALRQTGRPPLRLHLRLDQGDARLGPRRVAVLPRGDARGRRGPALHRAADGDPRLRGHRQRRPGGAVGGDRRRAGGRARRACPRPATRSPRRPSTSSLAPKSDAAGRALAAAERHVREHGAGAVPAWLRSGPRPGRTAAATTTRTGMPGHVASQELLPEGVAGERFYEPDDAEAQLARAPGRRFAGRAAPSSDNRLR